MHKSLAIYPTVAFCLLATFSIAQDCFSSRQADSLNLVRFFGQLESKGKIANWDFKQPLDQIDPLRVQLDPNGCYVRKLDLENTEIITHDKIFPGDVLNFSQLQFLDLSLLNINGNIPEDIVYLKHLDTLDLSYNKFTGVIPQIIDQIPLLKQFTVSNNELGGKLPNTIFNLKNVLDLNLSNNHFSGNLSSNIALLKNLELLRLGNNKLEGTIPESIGQLSNLKELNLSNNLFINKAPDSILQILPLEKLFLNGNLLTSIPVYKNPLFQLVDISDNGLTFQDIFPIYYNLNRETEFHYAPQKKQDLMKELYPNAGDKVVLETVIDDDIVDNIFSWYHDGIFLAKTKKHTINGFDGKLHTGNYYCILQNAMLPQLKLEVNYGNINCRASSGTYTFDLCEHDTKIFYGIPFNKNHLTDTLIMQNRNGCDSSLYVKANLLSSSVNQFIKEICFGESFVWNSQVYSTPGIYPQMFNNYLGCDSVVIMQLYVMDELSDNAEINKHQNNTADIQLHIKGGKAPYTYHWNTGSQEESLINLSSGKYSVTVTDKLSCSKIFEYELKLSTNNQSIDENTFSIHPNPVSFMGQLTVQKVIENKFSEIEFSLVDISGKKVFIKNLINKQAAFNIDLESVPPGFYTYIIKVDSQNTTGKLIVR